ncbi:hypothetical protein E2C01_095778 [Portunus trituberculatus]|uniref:Uncharacterized protein n=1 Tax=Portunus trituberculatus TaxID=210409 RepID=A0A5B7K121_PORTR|nr:hypothetical protein [Portunus trituberculatus]
MNSPFQNDHANLHTSISDIRDQGTEGSRLHNDHYHHNYDFPNSRHNDLIDRSSLGPHYRLTPPLLPRSHAPSEQAGGPLLTLPPQPLHFLPFSLAHTLKPPHLYP